MNSATSLGRATSILRKRTILLPIAGAFALTLLQPIAAYASGPEVITEKAISYSYTSASEFTAGQSLRINGFSSAALSSQYLPDANALSGASSYRLSYAGTALMSPGASKTVKYVKPAPKPEPEPVVEEAPAKIQLAATVAAPAPTPVAKPAPTPAPVPTPEPEPVSQAGERVPLGEQEAPIRWGGWAKAGAQFPYGYCTYFAAQYRGGVDFLGNGGQWYANAKAAGYNVGSTPRKDAIFVTTESGVGHVGIVIQVNSDGSFVTKEMNYNGFGVISSRTLSPSYPALIGFIY